jgi:hypothetical protein
VLAATYLSDALVRLESARLRYGISKGSLRREVVDLLERKDS